MKILVYPFPYFDDSFFYKDVILFPKNHNNGNKSLKIFAINFASNLNEYRSANNYIIYIYHFFRYLNYHKNYISSIYFFHITLLNLPLIIISKFLTNGEIIVKADLSKRNINYFKSLSFIRKWLFSIFLRFVDKVFVETKWLFLELNDVTPFKSFKHKLVFERNKIFTSLDDLISLQNSSKVKQLGSVLFYIRATDEVSADLKSFEKYIQILISPSVFFKGKKILIVADVLGIYERILKSALNITILDVTVFTRLNKKEFLALLSSAKYFVLLSKEESFNFTVIEASIANCKILSTDVGVIKDIKDEYDITPFSLQTPVHNINTTHFKLINLSKDFLDNLIYQ